MKPYSLDLRERVLAAAHEDPLSQAEIAKQFKIGLTTLERWLRRQRQTGKNTPLPHGGGRVRTLQGCEAFLRAALKHQPDATLDELCARVAEAKGVGVSASMMCRELQRLKLPRKKRRSTIANATHRG